MGSLILKMNKLYILAALGITSNALWTLDDFTGNYAGDCLSEDDFDKYWGWVLYDCGSSCESLSRFYWNRDDTDDDNDGVTCECYDNYGACGTLVDDPYYDPYYGGEPQIC